MGRNKVKIDSGRAFRYGSIICQIHIGLYLRDGQLTTTFYFSGFEIQLTPNSSTALPSWNRSLSLKPPLSVVESLFGLHGICNSTLLFYGFAISFFNSSTLSGLPFPTIDFQNPAFHTGLFMV